MNVYTRERIIKIDLAAKTRNEIDAMGESYYFIYLLTYYNNYESENELDAILSWVDKNSIDNKRFFLKALISFINDLNYKNYSEITSIINNKKREPSIIENFSSKPIPIGESIKESRKIKITTVKQIDNSNLDNNILKLSFLDWLDKKLLNEYEGEKPNEVVNRVEIHEWIKEKINQLEQSGIQKKEFSKAEKKQLEKIPTFKPEIIQEIIDILKR